MKRAVLAFGELLWDLLPSGKLLGGAPANFAYRLIERNIPVALVSRVGSDDLGSELISMLQGKSIPTDFLQIDKQYPTGTVDVMLDPNGNPTFTINPGVAYDYIESTTALKEEALKCSVFCYGTLVQRAEQTRMTLYELLETANQATKILDINLRKDCWSEETIKKSLDYADILKLNDDEVCVLKELFSLSGESLDSLSSEIISCFGLKACLITRGAKGVFAASVAERKVDLPGITVRVKDTIGSGDAFTAGFVAKLLEGKTLLECCTFGNELGAKVAATQGGMSAVS